MTCFELNDEGRGTRLISRISADGVGPMAPIALLTGCLLLAPAAGSGAAEPTAEPCPSQPQRLSGEGARADVLRLPGVLASWAFPRRPGP